MLHPPISSTVYYQGVFSSRHQPETGIASRGYFAFSEMRQEDNYMIRSFILCTLQ